MDKRKEFFLKLHKKLEAKYNIPPQCVGSIRNLALNKKMSREEAMDWADEKIKQYKPGQTAPPKFAALFNFLEDLPDDAWEDITQVTEYDKIP